MSTGYLPHFTVSSLKTVLFTPLSSAPVIVPVETGGTQYKFCMNEFVQKELCCPQTVSLIVKICSSKTAKYLYPACHISPERDFGFSNVISLPE